MKTKVPLGDGKTGRVYGEETLADFLKNNGICEDPVGRLEHINEDNDVMEKLAVCLEADIQQYLPDIAEIWGDEAVVVKVKENNAYAVWRTHWIPTEDFYQLVFKNSGVVRPEDFEAY